jgi:4-alpha-glucanotransferase
MKERSAGILLHITSLPSEFGIGDLGPQAFAFVDFLKSAGQKIWQILPLNVTGAVSDFSPYSSVSGMAGNILLISPGLLAEEGWLAERELEEFHFPETGKIDFAEVAKAKDAIFSKAWMNFKQRKDANAWKAFRKFCSEKKWLDDFALYYFIKTGQGGKPWYKWPGELMNRKQVALLQVVKRGKDEIGKIKFLQFIFEKQWQELKSYCNKKGIKILGDLPYYVSLDSVDGWTNPKIFKLNKNGKPIAVAGTPPDLFSEEGQLWNMPVYNWKVLKRRGYSWWIDRLKHNLQLFDLLRLDHFRGFSAYWEVPADSSANTGQWKKGPGADLFKMLKKKTGALPFVAEDLGEIDNAVFRLRDKFDLPGMKVLQFAFGKNMSDSEHIPHNYDENFFVFTGTHDNNATKGWWRKDINDETRNRIAEYCNKKLNEDNISSELIHLAYASVAKAAIIPMQDLLDLDETARMNTPGTMKNNWSWQLRSGQIDGTLEKRLNQLTKVYKR